MEKTIQEQLEDYKRIKEILEFIKQTIEEHCVYDEHLQGYYHDLPKGEVRKIGQLIGEKDVYNRKM